jgi:hypothetical protein
LYLVTKSSKSFAPSRLSRLSPRQVFSNGTINTGRGNDTITGIGTSTGINFNIGAVINTNDGNDEITGTGQSGIETYDTLNTDNGSDTVIGNGTDGYGILNGGNFKTGAGNDIITGTATTGWGIYNYFDSTIDTDDGNDIITGTSSNNIGIYNDGLINTGKGNDIVDALNGGFGGNGITNLGDGNDILKGFGSGSFNGGSDKNILELTAGSYTVGISGTTVSFTSDGITMNTSEFEKLIASSTMYDFTGLSNGQTITIA